MRAKTRLFPFREHRSPKIPAVPSVSGQRTEVETLAAARRGDLRAWSSFVRRHQELVFRSAYLVTRDSTLAEQTTRDAFLRAYRSLKTLHDHDVRAWLLRVTDTVARSRQRELVRQRDARVPEAEPMGRLQSSPLLLPPRTPIPSRFEQGVLVDAFDALDDQDRAVLAARYAFGLDRGAAASRLGLEPDAVESLLAAALARLRDRTTKAAMQASTHDAGRRNRIDPASGGRLSGLGDDQLGFMALVAVLSELHWTPDVEPLVHERLEREAVAYPVLPVVPDSTTSSAAPVAAAGTRPASARRGGPSIMRAAGLLAGATALLVALGFSVGWADDLDWEGADVPAGITALLREPVPALTGSAATDADFSQGPARPVPAAVDPVSGPSASHETRPWVPGLSVVGVRWQGDGSLNAVVRVAWPASLDPAAARQVRLERRAGDRSWTEQPWANAGDPLLAVVKPGRPYRFRVRITDAAGRERISAVSGVKLLVRGPRSARLVRSRNDWGAERGPVGNRRMVAVGPGARVRTQFSGTNVALIGHPGAATGSLGMRIDGGPWDEAPTAGARLGRSVLFSEVLDRGQHSLDVRALADGLAVDAILILHGLRA